MKANGKTSLVVTAPSSESDIRQMFQDQVAQALTEGDIEALVRFLKYTEVDFIHHKLTGPVQGNEAETFYFNEAGKKINDTERETYTRNLNHINNWLWGRAYSAAVPLKESATLMEIGPPEHEDSSVMKFIRSEIDMLLENKNGNYVVTADHAELCNGYIGFDARRPVEINVKSIKRAQTIARWFEGNALVNSRDQRARSLRSGKEIIKSGADRLCEDLGRDCLILKICPIR